MVQSALEQDIQDATVLQANTEGGTSDSQQSQNDSQTDNEDSKT